MEAVRKVWKDFFNYEQGYSVVAAVCSHCIVLGIEKKMAAQLQDPRSVKKLMQIDENITFLFAGLNADARKLVDIVVQYKDMLVVGTCRGSELPHGL